MSDSPQLAHSPSVVTSRPQHRTSRRITGGLLRRRVATLFQNLPAALNGDEEALHQIRVWGRRLRIAVRLLAGKPEGRRAKRCERLLAQLTRTAGNVRDLDVLLATLDERLRQLPARSAEQQRLRRRLLALRRRGRVRLAPALFELDIARLRRDLAELAPRACPDLVVVEQRLRARCTRENRKLCDGFAALGSVLDPVALHGLRRRARRLRYSIEIFIAIFGGEPSATRPWKALQDLMGSLHDHHVLAEWFDRQAQLDAERGKPTLAAAANAEAAWARGAMRRLHDELLAARPAELATHGLAAVGLHVQPTAG
jgi:CHAD domain-containing protein